MTSLDSGQKGMYRRTMSASVRRLQEELNKHLDLVEKTDFVEMLNDFNINRDMTLFVRKLKSLLDTPEKTQLFPLIKKVIPQGDVDEFERCLGHKSRRFDTMPAKQAKKRRSRPPLTETSSHIKPTTDKPLRQERKNKKGAISKRSADENTSDKSKSTVGRKTFRSIESVKQSPSYLKPGTSECKRIQLSQDPDVDGGFGFSIRGGSEYGIGIYVSMVDKGGMAEQKGLLPGDLIQEVNNKTFENKSHNDAAQIIKSYRKLDMVISRVGRIPGSFVVHQMYKWVNPVGRPVSPPPEVKPLGKIDDAMIKSGFALLTGPDERKINVTVGKGQSLGVMVRGGREFGLGIYISGVDQGSLADQAGLRVGDQILDVNGRSFMDITHPDSVHVLKTSKYLMFTIKRIGKLPYAKTKIDQTSWTSRPQQKKLGPRTTSQTSDGTSTMTSSKASAFRKGVGSQLMYNTAISSKWDVIENQAVQLLNDSEQGTLRYYLSEYQAGFITVDGLAMASFELLNTKAKMGLMKEIRNWVQIRDVEKFDTLIQRRQAQQMENLSFQHRTHSTYSLNDNKIGTSEDWHGPFKTASAPASRAATVRERSRGRGNRHVAELELEPLRQAIQQIDDHFQSEHSHRGNRKSASRRRKSISTEYMHESSHNLLKSSLSSKRSLSEEALSPVYNDTLSDFSPSPVHRSHPAAHRPRSSSASHRNKPTNSYSHRQRAGSNNSSLSRKYRSVEDIRSPSSRNTPYPSRRNSMEEVERRLSSVSYSQIPDLQQSYIHSPTTHFVNVDVHEQPTSQFIDGIPSDDSGVEVNGHVTNDPNNRVTISSDNPVNINDVLHSRSYVTSPSRDQVIHSNQSSLNSRKSRSSHRSIVSVTNQGKDDLIGTPSNFQYSLKPPVEIQINDGEGSIETMSIECPASPRFLNQSNTGFGRNRRYYRNDIYDTEDDNDDDNGGYDDDDDDETLESGSVAGDQTDSYDLSQQTGYNAARNYMESRKIEEAKKKYGDVPLYIIPVYKTKPTLGMAIEGGANTRQPVPKVINLQPGGSAYESGGLKVGHKILEVNGTSLVGLEHITAAKTVAEAFKNNTEDCMELLVTDSDIIIK